MHDDQADNQTTEVTLWQIFKSSAQAAFGVQKQENLVRDFKAGKPYQFVIVGITVAAIMVLAVVGLVMVVMRMAGA